MLASRWQSQENSYASSDIVQLSPVNFLFQRTAGASLLATATLYGALAVGTGGIISEPNVLGYRDLCSWPTLTLRPARQAKITVNAPLQGVTEQIQILRDVLGLRMSEVAQIFGVSRQAAYSWLSGSQPKPEIARRIWHLSHTAESIRVVCGSNLGNFIHRPMLNDGRSVYELIVRGDEISGLTAILRQAVAAEAAVRSSALKRNAGALNDKSSSLLELSRPVLQERNK